MRFIILLVAGAYAAADCKTMAGAVADQNTCQLSASDVTATACSTTNCAFGDANVARQWIDGDYDMAAEACRSGTPLVTADNCDKCLAKLQCTVGYMAASATREAASATDLLTAKCKDHLANGMLDGAAAPACVAIAAWYDTDAKKPSCTDPEAVAAFPTTTTEVYGPADTECTEVIYNKCQARMSCTEFGTFVAAYAAPAGGSSTDSSTDSTKSPAAMISAGIALVALLF